MKLSLIAAAFWAVSLAASEPESIRRGAYELSRHVVVISEHALLPEERVRLEASGLRIVDELGGHRYVAKMRLDSTAEEDGAIAEVANISPQSKLFSSARRALVALDPIIRSQLVFHGDVSSEEIARIVAAVGGKITSRMSSDSSIVEALIPRAALSVLAHRDEVAQIHANRRKIATFNASAASLSSVTPLYSAPYGLTGSGVVVTIFDVGNAQASHPEFQGRVTVETTDTIGVHPTHVTGTIAAAGLNPSAKGMAPGVTVHQYAVDDGFLEAKNSAFAATRPLSDNNSWGYTLGWYQNTSRPQQWEWWGNEEFGEYAIESAGIDELIRKHGTLVIYSSGNDNSDAGPGFAPFSHYHGESDTVFCKSSNGSGNDCPSSCGSCETVSHPSDGPFNSMSLTGSAKNVLTVGAVTSGGTIGSFSSRGPAKDGRIKPEVVAKGVVQFSTYTNSSYANLSGTSMAAPVATGISALVVEQWRRTFAGANPTPENLRTLLVHSATDLGAAGPDYTFGFGLINARAAVDTIIADNAAGARIRLDSVTQGAVLEYTTTLTANGTGRVTLGWSDPENSPYPGASLINDLDLSVVAADGTIIFPFVLDPNTPTAAASRGVNVRDNLERVEWNSLSGGVFTIRVTATRIASAAPQTFTLTTSNDLAGAAKPCADRFEPNDSQEAAFGRIPREATHKAAFCVAGDVDYYRFRVERAGPVSVSVTTSDTAVRVTMTAGSLSSTTTVAAGSSGTAQLTLPGSGAIAETTVFVRVEPVGAAGSIAEYTLRASYQNTSPVRRRPVRR